MVKNEQQKVKNEQLLRKVIIQAKMSQLKLYSSIIKNFTMLPLFSLKQCTH
jgi:hypothetical protein